MVNRKIIINFVAELLHTDKRMTKQELRKLIRDLKKQHSSDELLQASRKAMQRLIYNIKVREASTVLMYHSLPDEVCTHEAIDTLVGMGKTVLLPRVVSDDTMTIHQYRSPDDLEVGSFGILEPKGPQFDTLDLIDVCVVPGMAFSPDGRRLGRGKGYYDRFLSMVSAYKIGVCYDFQLLSDIPTDKTDIMMDEIIYS